MPNNKLWLVIKAINKTQAARNDFFRDPARYLKANGIEFKDAGIMDEVVARIRKLQASPIPGYDASLTDATMLSFLDKVGDPEGPSPDPNPGHDDLLIN